MSTQFRNASLALAVSIALGTTASVANAAEDGVNEEQIEKIAVVGSRGAPRSINDSPVPVDIIGGDELGKAGDTNMLELLKGTIPSLNVQANPISDAASLVRPVNLRGLSSDSTLILVNGKRRHRASVIALLGGGINDGAQGSDISVIPSAALKQVEVLRDGAAAQYGSDAIAGVMNFVLKDDDEGGDITLRYGSFYEGDGDTTELSGNIGLPLSENGFANLSFQYKTADATSRSVQRADAADLLAAGNDSVPSLAQVWGSPEVEDDLTVFGNFGLDLGNEKEAYMFANYSERNIRGGFYYRNPHTRPGVYGGLYRTADIGGGSILQTRPSTPENYIFSNPEDKRTPEQMIWDDAPATLLVGDLTGDMSGNCPNDIVVGNNVLDNPRYVNEVAGDPNCFAFNEILPGGFTPNFGGNIIDTAITAGTRGEFSDTLTYDISASVGMNESSYVIYDTLNASLGPNTPFDFAPGKHTQLEKSFNFDLVKELEVGFESPLIIAGGYEWHSESFEVTAGDVASFVDGPLTSQNFGIGSNGFPGFKPSAAGKFTRKNYAMYVDVEAQYTEDFLMGYAVRYEDYSSFGDTTNFKITAQYNVSDNFSVRGSVSTGFRAPTVGQANYANVQTNLSDGVLSDSALLPATNPIAAELGATELTPEESQSYAFGAVWDIEGFFFTLDYYNIQVEDRISQSDKISLTDINRQALKDAGVQNVDSIQQVSFFSNDFDTTTQGIDFVANYSTSLLDGDTTFALAYNWNETEVDRFTDVTGDFKVSRLENDLPNHRATFTWSQGWEDISLFTRVNYYGEYQGVHVDFDATAKDASAAVTVDAEISYFVTDDITVSLGAQNLLDQDAEELDFVDATGIPNNNWGGVFYETSPFGFNGGFYYLRANYSF